MPSPLLQLRIPQDLADWLEAKHPSRGEVAEYVRQLLTAEQMKEAVAPLVPEVPKRVWKGTAAEWAAFQEGAGFETPEPKPKARRKKGTVEAKRKPKTCQHSNTVRKLGMLFCEDCGEFVYQINP